MTHSKDLARALWGILQNSPSKEHGKIVEGFLGFLETHNRMVFLPSILKHLEFLNSEQIKHNTLLLETAFPMDDTLVQEIYSFLNVDKKTPAVHTINKDLIGGFRARFQGTISDGSIAYNIQKLKQQLIT